MSFLRWNLDFGSFDIMVNKKQVKSFAFKKGMTALERLDMRYQLRRVIIDPSYLIVGINNIKVTSKKMAGQVLIERETYPELTESSNTPPKLGTLAFKPTITKLKVGETLDFALSFTPAQPHIQALMIECPIPSGFDLVSPVNSIKLASSGVIDYIEVKQIQGEQRLCCHASLVEMKDIVTIQAKLLAKFKGDNIQVSPCAAYPMYRPDDIVHGTTTLLVVV